MARLTAEDHSLPEYVREKLEAFLRCGVLDNGFLRVVCEHCHAERLLAFCQLPPADGSANPSRLSTLLGT